MNKKIIGLLSVLVFILLIIWGYNSLYNSKVVSNENSNVNNQAEEIDTRDWVEYRNEELGFEFRYPQEWDAPDGWRDVLIINITKAEDLNNDIWKLKEIIEENKTQNIIQLDKQINAQLDVYYTTVTGINNIIVKDILYGVKFFINNDLIEVSIILPREVNFNLPEEKDKLDLFIQQIRDGNVEGETNIIMTSFNEVLSTFIF